MHVSTHGSKGTDSMKYILWNKTWRLHAALDLAWVQTNRASLPSANKKLFCGRRATKVVRAARKPPQVANLEEAIKLH